MLYWIISTVLFHATKGQEEPQCTAETITKCDFLITALETNSIDTTVESVQCVGGHCAATCNSQTDIDWCSNLESYLTCQSVEGLSDKFCAPDSTSTNSCGDCSTFLQPLVDAGTILNTRESACVDGHCSVTCESTNDDCPAIATALLSAGSEGKGLTLSCVSGACSPPDNMASCDTDAVCKGGIGSLAYDAVVAALAGSVDGPVCYMPTVGELGECTISCSDQTVCDAALVKAQEFGELEGQTFTCTNTANGDVCVPGDNSSSGDECSDSSDLSVDCARISDAVAGAEVVCAGGHCTMTCGIDDDCNSLGDGLTCQSYGEGTVCGPDSSGSSGDECTDSSDLSVVCAHISTAVAGAEVVCAGGHCSMTCGIDDDCNSLAAGLGTSETLTCQSYGAASVCGPDSSGSSGDECNDSSDLSVDCARIYDAGVEAVCAGGHCTMACGIDDDCNKLATGLGTSETLTCQSYGGGSVCGPDGNSGSSDCTSSNVDEDCKDINTFLSTVSITATVLCVEEQHCTMTCSSNDDCAALAAYFGSGDTLLCQSYNGQDICAPEEDTSGSSGDECNDSSDLSVDCARISTVVAGAEVVCAGGHCTMACNIDDDCNKLYDGLTCQPYGEGSVCGPSESESGCSTIDDCSYITVPTGESVSCNAEGECILTCGTTDTCSDVRSDLLCLDGKCQEPPECEVNTAAVDCVEGDEIFAAAINAVNEAGIETGGAVLCIDGSCEISCELGGDGTCTTALDGALAKAEAVNEGSSILELMASTILCDADTKTCDKQDKECDPLNGAVDGCVCTLTLETICKTMETEINTAIGSDLTFMCDPDTNRCTAVCENTDICTTAGGVLGGVSLECVPLRSGSNVNVCRESSGSTVGDEPTTTGTEDEPTSTEEVDCEMSQYPDWNGHSTNCMDEEGDGCALRIEVGVTVCNINGDMRLRNIRSNIKKAMKAVLDTLEDKTVTCDLDMIKVTEMTAATLLDNEETANTRGTNEPQTEGDCPDLDELCGVTNESPAYRLHAKISLTCGSCDELEILLINMAGMIQSGAIDTDFAVALLSGSEADDLLCGRGLGHVDISTTISVKLVAEDGTVLKEGVIIVDLGGSDASQRGFYVGIVVMLGVFTFFS